MKTNGTTDVRKERNKIVAIIFEETGERFEFEIRIAIPMIEDLRTRKLIKESPENMDVDIIRTAKLLYTLSELNQI